MKGVVFTEFLEHVEASFSPEVVDHLLDTCELASGGAYTSVGTYDAAEMVTLVGALSTHVDVTPATLLFGFGRHLFRRFVASFPEFFAEATSATEFLASVEGYVHLEVRKLYPDAELPTFDCSEQDGEFTMVYRSVRNLPDLAAGLIDGCLAHFGTPMNVRREGIAGDPGATRFVLSRA